MMCCTLKCFATLALIVFLAPLAVDAQPATKIPAVGVLEPGTVPTGPRSCLQAFRQRLHEFGYREGQTAVLEARFAVFQPDRLPDLASEVVQRQEG